MRERFSCIKVKPHIWKCRKLRREKKRETVCSQSVLIINTHSPIFPPFPHSFQLFLKAKLRNKLVLHSVSQSVTGVLLFCTINSILHRKFVILHCIFNSNFFFPYVFLPNNYLSVLIIPFMLHLSYWHSFLSSQIFLILRYFSLRLLEASWFLYSTGLTNDVSCIMCTKY